MTRWANVAAVRADDFVAHGRERLYHPGPLVVRRLFLDGQPAGLTGAPVLYPRQRAGLMPPVLPAPTAVQGPWRTAGSLR